MATSKYRIEGENATGAAFRSVLGDAQSTANKMGGVFKTAFAGVSAAVIATMGRQWITVGDDLQKAAVRAKLMAEEFTSLAYAGKQSDVSAGDLTMSLQRMQIFLSKAANGSKENVKTLTDLGIELEQIKALKSDQQFEAIAEQVSRLAEEEDQARVITEIFGKAGGNLLPMFQQGAAGIRAAREEAEKLGLTMTGDQLKKLADADDAIKKLDASWEHFGMTMFAKVAPALTAVMDEISGAALTKGTIDEQIKQLRIRQAMATASPSEKADFQARIDELNALKRSKSGRRGGGASSDAARSTLGLQDLRDQRTEGEESAKAAAAAKKVADAAGKEVARHNEQVEASFKKLQDDLFDASQKRVSDIFEADLKRIEIVEDAERESAEALAEYREELETDRRNRELALQQTISDQLANGFLHGKRGWDDMLDYWAHALLTKGFDKLIAKVFGDPGTVDSGGIFAGLASMLGFSRGGRPRPGVPYKVGEDGPEVRIDGPGTVLPNHALGGTGGVVIAPVYNIDARGATFDLVKALPGILRQNNEALKADLIEGFCRKKYPLSYG